MERTKAFEAKIFRKPENSERNKSKPIILASPRSVDWQEKQVQVRKINPCSPALFVFSVVI